MENFEEILRKDYVERGTFNSKTKVVYHANEWMCGLGALDSNIKDGINIGVIMHWC